MSESYDSRLKEINKRYERLTAGLEKDKLKAIFGLKTAIKFITYKEKNMTRKNKKLYGLINNLQEDRRFSPIGDRRIKALNGLKNELEMEREVAQTLSNRGEIIKELRNNAHQYLINMDEDSKRRTIEEMARNIAYNPIDAAEKYAEAYLNAVHRLEGLNEEKNKELRALQAAIKIEAQQLAKNEAEASPQSTGYDSRLTYRQTASYPTPVTPQTPAPETPAYNGAERNPQLERVATPISTATNQSIQRELEAAVYNRQLYMDYGFAKRIITHFKQAEQVEYSGDFYSERNIQDIYHLHMLTTKDNSTFPKLEEAIDLYVTIVEMGDLTINIVVKDLLNGKNYEHSKISEFMNKLEPHNALDNYDELVAKYLRLYDKLSDLDKSRVDEYAKAKVDYRKKFEISGTTGADVASYEGLKRIINEKIISEYLRDRIIESNYKENGEFSSKFEDNFIYSIRYMSADEIASFYKAIKKSDSRSSLEDTPKMEARRIEAAAIQRLFASAIRKKMNSKTDLKSDDEKQKNAEFELVAICKDYLKEKPLFPLQYVKLSEVPEEYARGRITSNEVTGDAFRRSKRVSGGAFRRSKRVRGLPLVTNVFQMMDYARLKELATKDVLTPEEIKEVDGMYRRH